jgi:hypothetical protein
MEIHHQVGGGAAPDSSPFFFQLAHLAAKSFLTYSANRSRKSNVPTRALASPATITFVGSTGIGRPAGVPRIVLLKEYKRPVASDSSQAVTVNFKVPT